LGNVLKKAIDEAIKGIENLKKTYNSDSITVAKLVLIVNKLTDVTLKLENMESLTNDIFTREVESEE
jgi:acyl carrier protein